MNIPHDIGAERAVLGAAILAPHVIHDAAAAGLTRSSFYREANALLWDVFFAVDKAGALDLVTIGAELDRRGKMEAIGGYAFVAGLPASCPSVSNIPVYFNALLKHERARKALQAIKTAEQALVTGDDPDDTLATLQAALGSGDAVESSVSWESETVAAVFNAIVAGEVGSTVYETPWPQVNESIGGLCDKEVTICVAQPRTGKSVFCDQIARHLAANLGIPGCYFALEMDRRRMTERRLSAEASVYYNRVQRPKTCTDEDIVALDAARQRLGEAPLRTDEAMLTMEQIWARTRSGVRREGWKWIVIDHAHIVRASDPKANRVAQLEHVGLLSKQIAKDCGVAVLLAAQMNKDALKRPNKRPQMGDIAYGGTIEQVAATVLGLYRDELYNEASEMRGKAEVIPIKARFGEGDRTFLDWQGPYQRFRAPTGGW